MTVVGLECRLPDFAYTARDASGVLENELCPVFVARPDPGTAFMPNPIEVMDWRWVRWTELRTAVRATPFVFSPWAVEQIEGLADLPLP